MAIFPGRGPEERVVKQPTLRDAFRIGPEGDPFWRCLRSTYIGYLARHVPMALLAGTLNVSVWAVFFDMRQLLPVWGICVATLIVVMLSRVTPFHRLLARGMATLFPGEAARFRPEKASARADWETRRTQIRILAKQGIFGVIWGGGFLYLLAIATPAQVPILVFQGIIILTIAAFINSITPLGMLTFHLPVVAGIAAGVVWNDPPDGSILLLLLALHSVIVVRSTWISFVAFYTHMRNRGQLLEQQEMVRLLLNEFETNGEEWLFEINAQGRLVFASPRFAEAAGRSVGDLLGKYWDEIVPRTPRNASFFRSAFQLQSFRNEVLETTVNGEHRWWQVSATPKCDNHGRVVGYRGVGLDITERERATKRVLRLATIDTLTGLLNRQVIHDVLSECLAQPAGATLLFIDLDRFKAVNDTLGHSCGDQLLKMVAARLKETCHRLLGDLAVAGRLGGDEFAVILKAGDIDGASRLGEAIIARLSEPYLLGTRQACIGASIGFATGPRHGATVEDLMRAADLALYDAKKRGRGQPRAYDPDLNFRANDEQRLGHALGHALQNGELKLVFQPIVNALDERIVCFESLLRWVSPQFGQVAPSRFIPIAEESDLIHSIGRWVLNEACRAASQWPKSVQVAVNVSSRQLDNPSFPDHVRQALEASGLSPWRLELELTESLFIDEHPRTVKVLEELKALGLRFALDDFGTGYASLGYLRRISFSRLKIDRSFIQDIGERDGQSATIVQAIVALAERLGMETTAEGAETRAEFETVRRLGCTQVQGYYFSEPVAEEDVTRLLRRMHPLIEFFDDSPTRTGDAGRWQSRSAASTLLPR